MDNSAQPNVFVNQPPAAGVPVPPAPSPGRKWITPKNIFIVLGIIVVVELILGVRAVINKPTSTQAPSETAGILNLPATKQSNKGAIILIADKKEVKPGDTVAVSVQVNSPQLTTGVDMVAKFDPTLLSAIDGDIHQGTIFSRYPLAKVDPAGVVSISGIATPGAPGFSGKDIFATVNFKALKAGKVSITLDFTPGSTADSNIVDSQSGQDLLEEVGNLEVVVK